MNKIVVIGSNAINKHIKDFRLKPSDFDILGKESYLKEYIEKLTELKKCYPVKDGKFFMEEQNNTKHEYDIIDNNKTKTNLYNYIINDKNSITEGNKIYPSLNVLYAIKNSHRYKKNSPHFLKTLNDIKCLKEQHNCIIPEDFKELFKELEKCFYNYSHPKLNQTKDNFFKDDGIVYIYDHDDIHVSVKTFDLPAYRYFIKDNEDVLCDREKFFNCSEEVRNAAVLEESYVLSLERSIIPFNNEHKRKNIFDLSLEKVCTSITSGWFREWAYDNYYKVQGMYNSNFVERFYEELDKGNIRKHQS